MDVDWEAEGLGLNYGTVALATTRPSWLRVGQRVTLALRLLLADHTAAIEHVGSTSVPDLIAKPIIDIAIGATAGTDRTAVSASLAAGGYDFRGDAGDDDGLVFVLEDRPRHRVVHLHVVEVGGPQWRDYLRFRDLLRASADARRAYADVKATLAARHVDDARGYTDAKTAIVRDLLGPR